MNGRRNIFTVEWRHDSYHKGYNLPMAIIQVDCINHHLLLRTKGVHAEPVASEH